MTTSVILYYTIFLLKNHSKKITAQAEPGSDREFYLRVLAVAFGVSLASIAATS